MSTATNVQPGKEVLEAEVSPEILQQFEILKNALKKNQELAQEFALNNNAEEFQRMDLEIAKVNKLVKQLRSSVRRERLKNHVLSEQVARDDQMAEQVNRRYEMLTKNPQYGRAQSIEYMHTIVTEHEKLLSENEATIAKVEDMLRNLMDPEKQSENVTEQDLSNHIRRFDEIFGVVATQIYSISEEVEKIKDAFLERQRKIYGRFARNPFEKRRRNEQVDAFQNLKGLDAFPSQNAVLSINLFGAAAAVPTPKQPTLGGFGAVTATAAPASGSIFGVAAPQQPAATQSTNFGLDAFRSQSSVLSINPTNNVFGAAAATSTPKQPTLGGFGVACTPASGSIFGTAAPQQPAAAQNTNFGSTLSSAASGTLFRGSASTAPVAFGTSTPSSTGVFGGTGKSLFSAK